MAAARHWATGGQDDSEGPLAALQAWGADAATLAEAKEALGQRQDGFAVWPDNWSAACLFGALSTQWRVIVMPRAWYWQGIDYTAIPVAMRLIGTPASERSRCFADLQVMELAAAEALNKRFGA